jgi:hypothetical protein
MELHEHLATELTELRQKAGNLETLDDFTGQYERLLKLLTATLTTMRTLAGAQGQWLMRQADEQRRMN